MRDDLEPNRNFHIVLREYVPADKKSLVVLSKKVGIHWRTIRSHRDGDSRPFWKDIYQYARLLGPDFVSDLFIELGVRAVPLEGEEKDGCYHTIAAETGKLPQKINEAHSDDGFVDHNENLRIVILVKRLIPKLGRFLAVRRAQTQ